MIHVFPSLTQKPNNIKICNKYLTKQSTWVNLSIFKGKNVYEHLNMTKKSNNAAGFLKKESCKPFDLKLTY